MELPTSARVLKIAVDLARASFVYWLHFWHVNEHERWGLSGRPVGQLGVFAKRNSLHVPESTRPDSDSARWRNPLCVVLGPKRIGHDRQRPRFDTQKHPREHSMSSAFDHQIARARNERNCESARKDICPSHESAGQEIATNPG
jgi:hypothetical protein